MIIKSNLTIFTKLKNNNFYILVIIFNLIIIIYKINYIYCILLL